MEENTAAGAVPAATKRVRMGRRQADRERYERVNKSWPDVVPALTEAEARTAIKRLWKIATKKAWGTRRIEFTTGRRRNKLWLSRAVVNCDPYHRGLYGWKWLVHSVSHWTHRGPEFHGTAHASHETWLVHEVVSRGWLDGRLRKPERPKKVVDKKAAAHLRLVAAHARWKTRQKRAATAVKKLEARIRLAEKRVVVVV